MTAEQLLLPRRKVINDFPFNQLTAPYDNREKIFAIGSILNFFKADNQGKVEYWYHHPVTGVNYQDTWMDQYPNIFNYLEWWEDRSEDEMSRYVKTTYDGTINEVDTYDFKTNTIYVNYPEGKCKFTLNAYLSARVPATEQEYNNFINSK